MSTTADRKYAGDLIVIHVDQFAGLHGYRTLAYTGTALCGAGTASRTEHEQTVIGRAHLATCKNCRRMLPPALLRPGAEDPFVQPSTHDFTRGDTHMVVKIIPNDKGNPPAQLAQAELHFTEGPLHGLKLIGFAIWERRTGTGRNVTFPARSYAVNGERRTFALLRPIIDTHAQERIRDLVLTAYAEYEAQAAIAS